MGTEIVNRQAKVSAALMHSPWPEFLQKVFAGRGVSRPDELERSLQHLLPFHQLSGMVQAIELLCVQLERQGRIVVCGDYDADGATSCALAVTALRSMGAQHVAFLVPNRFEFGYGLSPELVDVAAEMSPDLLITVDHGISSIEGVERAHAQGIQVLITDHHLPGEQLPRADAIVNPNLVDDPFPSKHLAGVGVVFYVMLALRSALREADWFVRQGIAEPNMGQFLDLVALGTVADVVPLDQNNRTLIYQGIRRIRAGKARPGIEALIAVANRQAERLTASDIGFAVAPRLNAAGRLEDMSIGVMCLLAEQPAQARRYAQELDRLNQQRREIEKEMHAQAMTLLDQLQLGSSLPDGLCLYEPRWHEGVIGILAGRIKERHYRPTVAFAQVEGSESEGELMLKGSARSVSGVHIRDALAEVDRRNPGLIAQFGGHAMAAGLSLAHRNLATFRQQFETVVSEAAQASDALQAKMMIDGELTMQELSVESARLIADAGPWGQQFPEPQFTGVFQILEQRLVGERHLKLVLRPKGETRAMVDAIHFNVDRQRWPNHHCRQVRLVYTLDENIYQDRSRLQLMVQYLEAAS